MIAADKRDTLMGNIPDNSLIILVGNRETLRNGDVMYPFRQDSDVLLLTGLNIPDISLIGYKQGNKSEWILYADDITEREKIWGTSKLSQSELMRCSGIADIRARGFWSKDIGVYRHTVEHIYIRTEQSSLREKNDLRRLHLSDQKEKLYSLDPFLRNLRMKKSEEEIRKIRTAIDITHTAYDFIRANIKPYLYEYEIEAYIAGVFRAHHALEAYPTIVASGLNSCTLHYIRHDRKIGKNDHILIDFGAEYDGYAADISRVFFVGDISLRQKAVHSAVLEVKKFAENLLRPGVKKSEYERQVRTYMNEQLFSLGLLSDRPSDAKDIEGVSRKYYPHSTSHFLGLDVHDIGGKDEILEPGMVMTCEPGIYIPEEGIGIRIEDDILITEGGCENLSREIPIVELLER